AAGVGGNGADAGGRADCLHHLRNRAGQRRASRARRARIPIARTGERWRRHGQCRLRTRAVIAAWPTNRALGQEISNFARRAPVYRSMLQEIKHALRTLAKSPVFSAIAVLSLALGVGANSALFAFHDSLLFRPLPVRDPATIVSVSADQPDNA